MKRKICFLTTGRADYGYLRPVMLKVKNDKDLQIQVVASGMHLSPEFGMTYEQIEADGFKIDEKVEILLSSDSPAGICKSSGLGVMGFAGAFERLKPDILVILGDRFECMAAAMAAQIFQIPISHLCGGESTLGVIDEAFRHSITKMSHLHFVTTDVYRRRVIQLGEEPGRVFNVGASSLDNIKGFKLLSKKKLERKLDFRLGSRNLLVTFHPVTLEKNTSGAQFKRLLDVLDELKETKLLFTKSNADTYGRVINTMIDDYAAENHGKARAFASLGQLRYFSALQYVDGVIGNSSSGILEVPGFKIGTINIGDRQQGRVRAKSIIDCQPRKSSIRGALKKLYSREFQGQLKTVTNPHGEGNAAKTIKRVLKTVELVDILKKPFYDLSSQAIL